MKTVIKAILFIFCFYHCIIDVKFSFSKVIYNTDFASKKFTFRELNLLSDDMILKGINPQYDFFIPTLSQLIQGRIILKLKASQNLRNDSNITILIDDLPYKTFNIVNLPSEIEIPFKRKGNREFVKITIRGNLRISNNICEDVFSENIWLLVYANSIVDFTYFKARNIREFIRDYDNYYCINVPELLPFVYQLCKYNPVPCNFTYKHQITTSCKGIELSKDGILRLEKNILHVPPLARDPFEEGIFPSFLFGGAQKIEKVYQEIRESKSEVSLKELGFQTVSVGGVSNLSYDMPLDLARLGGLPDRLNFKLFIAHTPVHKKDNMELRIYLNRKMVQTYSLEGSGKKSFDIALPTEELDYGINYLRVNLVNFTSSDNCFGAVAHNVLTVFEDSYFYWNNLRKNPKSILDFMKALNGYVALVINDPSFYPYATKFVSELGIYNKNIKALDLNPTNLSKYDFVIAFENAKNTAGMPIELSHGEFQLINPLTGKVIFASKPAEAFGVIMVGKKNDKPALVFSYYPKASGVSALYLYSYRDLLELAGNTAVATEDFISSYEVGKKLRAEYIYKRGFSYYWNKYKLWIILLLVVPATVFLAYVYRKLTRRQA